MMGVSNPIYSRRKRFLPEYRELFAALLKIPDKDVRDRVTDAINGFQSCPNCKTKQNCQYTMDVGTQTEDNIWQITNSLVIDQGTTTTSKTEEREKRRRKRKRNCPKVVKTAQHSSIVPILKQDPNKLTIQNTSDGERQPRKLMRIDSNDDAVSVFFQNCESNVLDSDLEDNILHSQNNLETIKHQMKIEWETSDQRNHAGFLPIHEAIIQNELPKLKKQLYVWKFRGKDLLSLVTDDDDNPIQLAVKENCIKSIIDELLKENLNLDDNFDNESNNIIHLAVLYLSNDDDTIQQKKILQTLESLLKKVDLKTLLQKNDDGLTPLHIAVKRNEYLMAEKILSCIDERLNLKSVASLDNASADELTFSQYYCRQCDSFKGRETNDLKQEILNATDMKRGCSVLYFAMELGYEHLVYLLLAHMCNPATKNLAGLDAKTYYTECGKNASIVGVLEKLAPALQKQNNL
ncbi:uncharacterized protein LOC129905924 [Episyrphus balteatus]|uniref:uncharacterized protein LOC129905924 n=1 Tax=Episyrphus balteatus TaxID=286459 RepID=UPI0024856E30|nr:uncharacterized protein LOC129905924 [Episyrphus balteatus]